jgi:hypothetical protein
MTWFYGDYKATEEDVHKFLLKTRFSSEKQQIVIGTDSHTEGRNFRFVTILCLYTIGKGGDFFRLITYEPKTNFKQGANTEIGKNKRHHNHKLRMFNEVAKSIELADSIKNKFNINPIIHIDASPPGSKHFTAAFSSELTGYTEASGYEAVLKPGSWAASCCADRFSK